MSQLITSFKHGRYANFDQGSNGIVVPAQLFFGPAALVVSRLLHRRHVERTTAEWLLEQTGPSGAAPEVAPTAGVHVGRPVEPDLVATGTGAAR